MWGRYAEPLDPVSAAADDAGSAAAAAAAANAGGARSPAAPGAATTVATAATAVATSEAAGVAGAKAEILDAAAKGAGRTGAGDNNINRDNTIQALKAMVEEARYADKISVALVDARKINPFLNSVNIYFALA